MTGLYILATLFLQMWVKQRISILHIIVGVIAIWVVWDLKYYFIGLFIPALLATWLTRTITEKRGINNFAIEIPIWLLIFLITCLAATFAHPNFSLTQMLDVLISNNLAYLKFSNPDDVIHYFDLKNTWLSIVFNSPWALVSGLFRPFIWEANTFLKFAVSIENLVLLVVTIMSLRSLLFDLKKSPHRILILAIVVYAASLCIFLAISTPNFGTLVRYRVGFLPFLLIIVLNQPMIVKHLSKTFNVHTPDLSH